MSYFCKPSPFYLIYDASLLRSFGHLLYDVLCFSMFKCIYMYIPRLSKIPQWMVWTACILVVKIQNCLACWALFLLLSDIETTRLFQLHIVLPHINIYIKIYQFNTIYGKGVRLQVRKLSYSPPPAQIINNQSVMAIQHIKKVFKKNKENLQDKKMDWGEKERVRDKDIVAASDGRGINCFRNTWHLCNGGLHLL